MESVARGSDGRRLLTAGFKRAQIDRLLKREITASELSRELEVARSLIQRWRCPATKRAEAAVGSNGDAVPPYGLGPPGHRSRNSGAWWASRRWSWRSCAWRARR